MCLKLITVATTQKKNGEEKTRDNEMSITIVLGKALMTI